MFSPELVKHFISLQKQSETWAFFFELSVGWLVDKNTALSCPSTIPPTRVLKAFCTFFQVSTIRASFGHSSNSPSFSNFAGLSFTDFVPLTEHQVRDITNLLKKSKLLLLFLLPSCLSALAYWFWLLPRSLITPCQRAAPSSSKHATVSLLLKKPNLSPNDMNYHRVSIISDSGGCPSPAARAFWHVPSLELFQSAPPNQDCSGAGHKLLIIWLW